MRPLMVIIMENTLGSMALRGLLSDIAPGIDVVCYKSLEEYQSASVDCIPHFFVSATEVFHNVEFFRPMMRRTIVITEGMASSFSLAGFRTLDATASEQQIVRTILQMHHMGHPSGHTLHSHENGGDDTQQILSTRERDVLALIVKGYINKEIADMLNISLATVIFHRNNISEKLNTRSIGRLTIYAVLNNIVAISDL